jgi:hypothetical protein
VFAARHLPLARATSCRKLVGLIRRADLRAGFFTRLIGVLSAVPILRKSSGVTLVLQKAIGGLLVELHPAPA